MKYYSEEDSKSLRLAFEQKVLHWREVSTKKMFGCPCYLANGRLFAFVITRGIVMTCLGEADRETLSGWKETGSFQAGKKRVQNWIKFSIKNDKNLDRIMPFVRKSHRAALLSGKRAAG